MQRSSFMSRCLILLTSAGIGLLLAGCVPEPDRPADTFGVDFSGIESPDEPSVMLFFVDGLNVEIFEEMLLAGELPTIRKHFYDRGLYCNHTVANVPSITLANQTSIVTGKFPGHHGILANNWFDRNRMVYRDYATISQKNTLDGDHTSETVFDMLPDRTTVSMLFQSQRGATKFIENRISGVSPYALGWYQFLDRLTLHRFDMWADIARKRGELPGLTFVYQVAADFAAYGSGATSPEYREAIRHVDYQMGRVLGDMERAGILDKLHLVLVSDHGIFDVDDHFFVEDFIEDEFDLPVGRQRLWENSPFESRLRAYDRYTAVAYGSGDRHRAIQLRRPLREDGAVVGQADWIRRPSAGDLHAYPTPTGDVNLIEAFVNEEAIEAVGYTTGENIARLRVVDGEVEFHQPDGPSGPISYRVIEGDDPLGWRDEIDPALLDGKAHSIRQWLVGAIETDYPGLAQGITAYFRARRAGDLALFAAPGWDFGHRTDGDYLKAGHGGLRREEMLTPLLIAGPGIPHGRIAVAQTVDIMPTLLDLLDHPAPAGIDGRSLLNTCDKHGGFCGAREEALCVPAVAR
jgi:hypothetical protein